MKWRDASEVVFGYILSGKITPEQVSPRVFAPPYDEAMKLIVDGNDIAVLYDKVGFQPIEAAIRAAQTIGDQHPTEFIKVLETSYGREELASVLDRESSKLRRGDDADLIKIESAMERHLNLEHRYQALDDIDMSDDLDPWMETGYEPFDTWFGGIPKSGLTILGAPPGTGKTSLAINTALGVAGLGKKVLFYTLEMTAGQIKKRFAEIRGEDPDEKISKNIMVCDEILELDEVVSEASRICAVEKIGIIIVDFADLLLNSAEEESTVAMLYRQMARLAKKTKTPVLLLSQLNRRYAEEGGIPRLHHIRWSGLAEAMGAMILLVYNPNQIFGSPAKRDTSLPPLEGRGYIIQAKSRFGYKQKTVGAIQIEWLNERGWADRGIGWVTLAGR